MLESIVKKLDDKKIVNPLFSGPIFNNLNNANGGYGSGVGGGMGDNNQQTHNGGYNNQDNSSQRMRDIINEKPGRQGDVRYSHGYDMPESGAQLHVHEDENGCFSHFKTYEGEHVGPTLNSYETAMATWAALQTHLKKF